MAKPVREDDLDPVGRQMLATLRKLVAYACTGGNCGVCCDAEMPSHADDCPVPDAIEVLERLGIDWQKEI